MIRIFYSIKQKIYEYKRKNITDGIPIYMVHHVTEKPDALYQNLTISTKEFIDFVNRLNCSGYQFIVPDQLIDSFGKKTCMLSFDDVCKDAMENAIPYLEANQIPYVCFVSPGFIGKESYITRQDFAYLNRSNLCTIGAHGINHRIFRTLTRQQKLEELSRTRHEELLGCTINDFAFPYGSFYACDNESVNMACKEYSRVYTTLSCKVLSDDLNFFLPRINLNSKSVRHM